MLQLCSEMSSFSNKLLYSGDQVTRINSYKLAKSLLPFRRLLLGELRLIQSFDSFLTSKAQESISC